VTIDVLCIPYRIGLVRSGRSGDHADKLLVKVVALAGGSDKGMRNSPGQQTGLSRDCVIRALTSRKLAMNSASQGL